MPARSAFIPLSIATGTATVSLVRQNKETRKHATLALHPDCRRGRCLTLGFRRGSHCAAEDTAFRPPLRRQDPRSIWTTAYITRNHGYMVYDTLFAMDAKNEIKPQMLEKYEASADNLSYTLTLRDGMLWHDGAPVTQRIASLPSSAGPPRMRWAKAHDVRLRPGSPDAKTIVIKLKEQTGLVLQALGKPSSNVPFMMPSESLKPIPTSRSTISRGPARSSSRRMNGSPAPRSSTSSSTSISRAQNPRRALQAARW